MLDQASLKLLLRARAELIAAMLLIGSRVRQKHAAKRNRLAGRVSESDLGGMESA
jgi:hypothetical protein